MNTRRSTLRSAFTLVEIMVAIGILSMVLAAIYSSWTSILRASKVGLDAAASAQRARITIRVLEDSLASAQSFAVNLPYYYFDAENGDSPVLSFVARLSKSFPRSGKFGDLDVRRVTFSVESAPDGSRQLVLRQNPLVMEMDRDEKEHPIVLAKNLKGLEMQFWDTNKNPPDWVDEWGEKKTNQLPKMVMVTLKLADRPHSSQVTEEITRIIGIPGYDRASSVAGATRRGRPRGARRPGKSGRAGRAGYARSTGHAWSSRHDAWRARRHANETAMRIPPGSRNRSERGIALVIVMISILVLTILAAGFAYSMKVETKLARNANSEAELEWLGRSGVEYARWVLANSLANPMQPYDSLDQPWATGSGSLGPTNNPIADVQNPLTLGHGTVTWKITDLESKFNINASEQILQQVLPQALTLMGVAAGESTPIVNSIIDWIDPDDNTHVEGAETEHYQNLNPPYTAKNGPIDDISELLLIKGITPEIYYGGAATNYQPTYYSRQRNPFNQSADAVPTISVGMASLFTPLSDGKININTASAEVLQLIPGVDPMIAEAIVGGRSGEDDGSGLMGPYRSVSQVSRIPNLPLPLVGQIGQYCDVRSKTFKVDITATMNGYSRYFTAVLGRNSARDVQVLSFYWSDESQSKH